jgi:hypothetical protein
MGAAWAEARWTWRKSYTSLRKFRFILYSAQGDV